MSYRTFAAAVASERFDGTVNCAELLKRQRQLHRFEPRLEGLNALRGGRGWLPIVVHGVGFLFGFSFFPYTLIVIALFGISLPQYLICYLLNDPIQKNIISPWERMQAQKET